MIADRKPFEALVVLVVSHYSDKYKTRSPFILSCLVALIFGYAICISGAPRGAKYFGTFLCASGSFGAFPGGISWYVYLRAASALVRMLAFTFHPQVRK